MNLEDTLKQALNNGENNIVQTVDTTIEKPKVIYLSENEVRLENKFEVELANDIELLEQVKARIDAKKEKIKQFIEENNLGSFKTDLLIVKYVSATTTTSIDSAKLKKELPDIAAKYSKVSARSSSVSIGLQDTPATVTDILKI